MSGVFMSHLPIDHCVFIKVKGKEVGITLPISCFQYAVLSRFTRRCGMVYVLFLCTLVM